MMKRLLQMILIAAITLTAEKPVLTQERQQGSGFLGGTLYYLTLKPVQEELKLSDEQIKKVQELAEKQRANRPNSRKLGGAEFRRQFAEFSKNQNEAVAKILDAKQLKRVKQIALQQEGAFIFIKKEVVTEIKITDEQKEKIREIQRNALKEFTELRRAGETAKKRQEVYKAMHEKLMGVLTAEQRTKLKEMLGEPFKGDIVNPNIAFIRNLKNSGSGK